MDVSYPPEVEEFRARIRAWLVANVDPEWNAASESVLGSPEWLAASKKWTLKLYEAGWAGIGWPEEYGGTVLSPLEVQVFREELARVAAPSVCNTVGVLMSGPAIFEHGTDEQKRRFLPPILRGDEMWCLLLSEPGAGSDLASLSTRAVRDGNEYVITGQKVWTGLAHVSDRGLLLCRTNPDEPKHRGLSAIMLDMHQPGVEVRPLRQSSGEAEFNEVFFDEARASVDDRIGQENRGWAVAMTTLMNERDALGSGTLRRHQRIADDLVAMVRDADGDGDVDAATADRVLGAWCDARVHEYLDYRSLTRRVRGLAPGPDSSVAKLAASQLYMELHELVIDILGEPGLLWKDAPATVDNGRWAYGYIRSRPATIEAGTSDIQRTIIAEHLLGLPRG